MKALIVFCLLLATPCAAAEAPKTPTVAELQAQLAQANAQITNLKTVIQLLQQQRDTAQKQAADNSIEAYMAQHQVSTTSGNDGKK